MKPDDYSALSSISQRLRGEHSLCTEAVTLQLTGQSLCLRSNSAALLEYLRGYFSHVVGDEKSDSQEIILLECPQPSLELMFNDWQREPGKLGRKDSYHDLPAARLIRKVRSGIVFLQSQTQRIAAGPCRRYVSQVINFINSQYMNYLQQHHWLICHASCISHAGQALAIAGLSGGGKSTLMLQLLEHEEIKFLSNDRLFLKQQAQSIQARGVPKLPRINPGTIVGNQRLHQLISADRLNALRAMPEDELWVLEEKHDVDIDQLYGQGRIAQSAPLKALLILDWHRESTSAVSLETVNLSQRPELLSAIMKSSGPFYQYADGRFYRDTTQPRASDYQSVLAGTRIYLASGAIDFAALGKLCQSVILEADE